MNMDKQKMISWIQNWKLAILLFANAIIFMGLFYYDISQRSGIGTREIIGDVSYKFNKAQRKFEKEITWDEIDANSPLTNRDTVRTAENSIAIIQLKDGTEIEMDEDSMVILEISPRKQKINFEKGSINIKKNPVEGQEANSVMIESANGNITINDGDVIVAKNDKKSLDVGVSRGQAEVEFDGQSVHLKKNQKLISNDGVISAKESVVRMEDPKKRAISMERKIIASVTPKLNLIEAESIQSIQSSNSDSQNLNPNPTSPSVSDEQNPTIDPATKDTTGNKSKKVETGSDQTKEIQQKTTTKTTDRPVKKMNSKQPQSTPVPESDELRRKREQEALERFLKM